MHGVAERPKSQLFQLKQSLLLDDDSITEDSRQQDSRVELEFTGGEEKDFVWGCGRERLLPELRAVATKAPPPNLGCTELEHELLVGDEEQRPQSVRPEMPVRRRQSFCAFNQNESD